MLVARLNFKGFVVVTLSLQFHRELKGLECEDDQFTCAHDGNCVHLSWFCDGVVGCEDGSDEIYRNNSLKYPNETTFCREKRGSQFCPVPPSLKSRRNLICEQKFGCNDDQFSCLDGITCIDPIYFCDGQKDCPDNSEENYRNENLTYPNETTFCKGKAGSKFCPVPLSLKTRKQLICERKLKCGEDQFSCRDGITCVDVNFFCDGSNDCPDGSDEQYRYHAVSYPKDTMFCRRHDKSGIGYSLVCEFPPELSSRTDLCEESTPDDPTQVGETDCRVKLILWWTCSSTSCSSGPECEEEQQFSCYHGVSCIPFHWFCNGYDNCVDGSDELQNPAGMGRMCDSLDPQTSERKCLLPENFVCESARNESNRLTCQDGIDECLCSDEFSKLCDGIIDCPDLSDECLCRTKPQVCNYVIWNENLVPRLTCGSYTTLHNMSVELICDGSEECSNGLDERNCFREAIHGKGSPKARQENIYASPKNYTCPENGKHATRCDGNPECTFGVEEEECQCTQNPKFCDYVHNDFFRCTTKAKKGLFTESSILGGHQVCDGQLNCEGMEDEKSCLNRFYCGLEPLPNIPLTKICDKVDDCEDARDEVNCTHFYCKDQGSVKYLDRRKVCDGNQDCVGGSDECDPSCIKSVFSDEKSMIKYKWLSAIVSILGFVAFGGNVTVTLLMIRRLKNIYKRRNLDNKGAKLTAVLIMNLSISDLLVGIYILAIFLKTVEVEGKYCLIDREWRSSLTCSLIGAILVVGSEESVFTMVLITIMRMRMVLRPRSNLFLKPIFAIILVTWILSVTIALVPLIHSLEDYFVDSIWYKNNSLFTTIEKNEVVNLTNWLSFYFNKANYSDGVGSWGELEEMVKIFDPSLTVAQHYGFYSSHAVCLPTFLPDREIDTAWAYSLAMILVNFFAFFVIAIGYGIMFKEAVKPNRAVQASRHLIKNRDRQNEEMQRKLIRIVTSDFLCWMPVCFMAFCRVAGLNISPDAYLPIGLIIIPINSALNPFLYSDVPDIIWKKLAPFRICLHGKCCLPVGNICKGIREKYESTVVIENLAGVSHQHAVEIQVIEIKRDLGEKSREATNKLYKTAVVDLTAVDEDRIVDKSEKVDRDWKWRQLNRNEKR